MSKNNEKNNQKYIYHRVIFFIAACSTLVNVANAGIVISSTYDDSTETAIYQKGIAVYLKDGKANSIIDTNTNNCIAINHDLKRYLFIKCNKFKMVVKYLSSVKQKHLNKKIPLAVQELMSANLPPKTAITIKRSGRGSYQGFHVEKYQFIVDDEIVSEYWMSGILDEKIAKEINISKLNAIFKIRNKNKFNEGLDSKIDLKYLEFKKKRFALKEFRYTGSKTKKIYRHVSVRRVKIRKYMPPKTYQISSSINDYLNNDAEL